MCLLAAMLAIALVMFNLLSVNNYVPGSAPHSRDRGVLPSSIVLMGAAPQNVTSQVPTDLQTTNDSLLTSNASILQPTTPAPVTPNPLEDLGTALSRTLWSLGFTLGYVFHGVAVVLLDEPIRVKNVSKRHMRVSICPIRIAGSSGGGGGFDTKFFFYFLLSFFLSFFLFN